MSQELWRYHPRDKPMRPGPIKTITTFRTYATYRNNHHQHYELGQGPEGTGTCQGDSGSSLQYHNSEEQRFSIFINIHYWPFVDMIIWWSLRFVIVGAFAVVVVAPFCWFLLIYLYCLSALDGTMILLLVVVVVVDLLFLPISNCNQPRWIQFGIVSFGASTGCGTGHPNGYLSSLSFYWIFFL